MATPGIIITQPGIDARTAADYQMIFNSNWPSLQIAFEGVISVSAGGTGQTAHNLGFYPITMAWYSVNGVSMGRWYGTTSFDKTNVYIANTGSSNYFGARQTTSDVVVSIKCYNIDISQSKDYTLPLAPTFKVPYDSTYGIKVVKNGKAITSTDLRDFILHSRAQSPAILSILTQDKGKIGGGIKAISYTNPANYAPWVLGFISVGGDNTKYQCYPPGGNQAAPAFFQLGSTAIVWTDGITGNGTLVVLRDPLVLANKTQVIYNG